MVYILDEFKIGCLVRVYWFDSIDIVAVVVHTYIWRWSDTR